ncbi:MAG: hypothetical protein QOF46_2013 [Paraburkholderia sp.]|nr:hypothetical protein [Paraburkholderia sp.]
MSYTSTSRTLNELHLNELYLNELYLNEPHLDCRLERHARCRHAPSC